MSGVLIHSKRVLRHFLHISFCVTGKLFIN